MSKPIKLTDSLIQKIQAEFVANIKKQKMFDGNISYSKKFEWNDNERAKIVFTPEAFAKMTMLVQSFDSEVAWHGVATRDEEDKSLFHVSDILVYPQVVSGSTVNTDQDKYEQWLYSFDDDVFNNIRMQGHSHVSFSTMPSSVDTTHQEKILEQLDDDMFYIFMIWNKKFERTISVFDLANNTMFSNEDVDVTIGDCGVDLSAFLKEAKKEVKQKIYTAGVSVGGKSNYGQSKSSKPTAKPKNSSKVEVADDDDLPPYSYGGYNGNYWGTSYPYYK